MDRYLADGSMADGMYQVAGIAYYCSQGWTRIFKNSFKSNHNDVTFAESGGGCTCSGSGLNNNIQAHGSTGWHVGVTGCPNSNELSRTISGQGMTYAWGFEPDMADIGVVSAIRHIGVNHENHGYDHTDWATELVDVSPMSDNGEFGSAVKDANGNWQWFAKYGVDTYDLEKSVELTYPYFSFMYSTGGPPACDEGNSDGFDMKDWEIWVL